MLGYVAPDDDPARRARFARLTAGGVAHAEAGFAVGLRPLPALPGERRDAAALADDGRYLLAFDGHALDLDASAAARPADWLLREHARRGPGTLDNRDGAYAACLFDRRERRAWITTCAFGRRDLYYLREGAGLLFATDLETLLRLCARRPALSPEHVSRALLCGATYGGATLLKGVRRALPGARLAVSRAGLREEGPAPLPEPPGGRPAGQAAAAEELGLRLRAAVARLTRVVPHSVVLAGGAGVATPLLAACVKQATGRLDVLTMAQPVPPRDADDTAVFARALGGRHHVSRFDPRRGDLLGELETLVRVLEEPASFGLGLLLPALGRDARALSDGFLCAAGAGALFGDPDRPEGAGRDSLARVPRRALDLEQVVYLTGARPDDPLRVLRARLAGAPRQAPLRLPLLLREGLALRSAARLARFHRIQAHFPYLDLALVGLALRLPPAWRGPRQPLLRRLLARSLAPALPPPGQAAPSADPVEWLRASGRLDALLDLLDEPRTRQRGPYRRRGLARLVSVCRHAWPERRWRAVLWQLALFELFCRRFVDPGGLDPF
jgi:asparagine synthetase B (glutamine-hydrolysing)